MAKQVKPFQIPCSIVYMAWCDYNDCENTPEPDGPVYFDSPPKIGDTAILSDGNLWKVTREPNERMEVYFELDYEVEKLKTAEEDLINDVIEIIEASDNESLIEIARAIIKECNNQKCSSCNSLRKKIKRLEDLL